MTGISGLGNKNIAAASETDVEKDKRREAELQSFKQTQSKTISDKSAEELREVISVAPIAAIAPKPVVQQDPIEKLVKFVENAFVDKQIIFFGETHNQPKSDGVFSEPEMLVACKDVKYVLVELPSELTHKCADGLTRSSAVIFKEFSLKTPGADKNLESLVEASVDGSIANIQSKMKLYKSMRTIGAEIIPIDNYKLWALSNNEENILKYSEERGILMGNEINQILKSHPDHKAIVIIGGAHIEEVDLNKDGEIKKSTYATVNEASGGRAAAVRIVLDPTITKASASDVKKKMHEQSIMNLNTSTHFQFMVSAYSCLDYQSLYDKLVIEGNPQKLKVIIDKIIKTSPELTKIVNQGGPKTDLDYHSAVKGFTNNALDFIDNSTTAEFKSNTQPGYEKEMLEALKYDAAMILISSMEIMLSIPKKYLFINPDVAFDENNKVTFASKSKKFLRQFELN